MTVKKASVKEAFFAGGLSRGACRLISEDRINTFRILTAQAGATSDEIWGWEDEDSTTCQFLTGSVSPKQYAKQLKEAYSGG